VSSFVYDMNKLLLGDDVAQMSRCPDAGNRSRCYHDEYYQLGVLRVTSTLRSSCGRGSGSRGSIIATMSGTPHGVFSRLFPRLPLASSNVVSRC
jgi:hypothetical protein